MADPLTIEEMPPGRAPAHRTAHARRSSSRPALRRGARRHPRLGRSTGRRRHPRLGASAPQRPRMARRPDRRAPGPEDRRPLTATDRRLQRRLLVQPRRRLVGRSRFRACRRPRRWVPGVEEGLGCQPRRWGKPERKIHNRTTVRAHGECRYIESCRGACCRIPHRHVKLSSLNLVDSPLGWTDRGDSTSANTICSFWLLTESSQRITVPFTIRDANPPPLPITRAAAAGRGHRTSRRSRSTRHAARWRWTGWSKPPRTGSRPPESSLTGTTTGTGAPPLTS